MAEPASHSTVAIPSGMGSAGGCGLGGAVARRPPDRVGPQSRARGWHVGADGLRRGAWVDGIDLEAIIVSSRPTIASGLWHGTDIRSAQHHTGQASVAPPIIEGVRKRTICYVDRAARPK
jgi:hypothetical protein